MDANAVSLKRPDSFDLQGMKEAVVIAVLSRTLLSAFGIIARDQRPGQSER